MPAQAAGVVAGVLRGAAKTPIVNSPVAWWVYPQVRQTPDSILSSKGESRVFSNVVAATRETIFPELNVRLYLFKETDLAFHDHG